MGGIRISVTSIYADPPSGCWRSEGRGLPTVGLTMSRIAPFDAHRDHDGHIAVDFRPSLHVTHHIKV